MVWGALSNSHLISEVILASKLPKVYFQISVFSKIKYSAGRFEAIGGSFTYKVSTVDSVPIPSLTSIVI